jgi:TM2 domain-containing membrane protein YozV
MVDRRKRRSDKKKVVAALLCFFVGVLGVHRFYVGKVFTGILMIVVLLLPLLIIPNMMMKDFNFGMLWIWAIIDFVRIIKGSFGDKENRGLS